VVPGPPPAAFLRALALLAAVAVAFADSSIVVLALPELLGRFHASIEGVAWVVTAFNLVVAAAALALGSSRGRCAGGLTRPGLAIFLAASCACAAAPSLSWLVALRVLQGAGAALLLAGSLPVLAHLMGDRRRAVAWWALAGSAGAALGPALGGLLTEVFDWRAIFVAQVPPAAVALLTTPRAPAAAPAARTRPGPRALGADAALALVSGALVAALFPAVVLMINGWGLRPLAAAAVVSALPLATVAARPLARPLPARTTLATGAVILAVGLVALALLPGREPALAAWALACCGLGIGLTVPELVRAGMADGPDLGSTASWSVGVRHLGLVVGLVAMTPLLAHDMTSAGHRIRDAGAARLLDAPLPVATKVELAEALERGTREGRTTPGALLEPLRARERDEPALAGLRRSLEDLLAAALTRAFRRGFLLAAGLALLALAPILVVRRR
jgi:predicted MFS family arabinose efflux permease